MTAKIQKESKGKSRSVSSSGSWSNCTGTVRDSIVQLANLAMMGWCGDGNSGGANVSDTKDSVRFFTEFAGSVMLGTKRTEWVV